MNKERYQWYMGTSEIIDNKTKKFITQDCPELLNKQSKQISYIETKLADLQQEQIAEMKEHQEAMKLADDTIKELEANLELHKQSNVVLNDQLNKATEHLGELEDKLAEKESEADQRYKDWQEEIRECDGLRVVLSEVRKQLDDTETQNKRVLEKLELIVSANQELEQKLAEKDKEISNLKNIVNGIDTLKQYDKDAKQIILINPDNVYADGHKLVIKQADQDKISFAVEKLYNVRCFVEDIDFNYGDDKRIDRFAVMNEIDDIIEQLPHQHEDKGE